MLFTPFYRTWSAHGWPAPAESDPARISWRRGIGGAGVPQDPKLPARLVLPDAGEQAAYAAWHRFRQDGLRHYSDDRNRPDLDNTSRMSVYLKYGAIHPRTEPWERPAGVPADYVERIVNHAAERTRSLANYRKLRVRPSNGHAADR